MIWAGPTDGVSDCTPYLNSVINHITGTGDTVLEIPSGQFYFYSPPLTLPRMTIRGQGKLATVLHKKFDNGAMFYLQGDKGGGIVIEDLACLCYNANTPGYFVYMAGNSTYQPDCSIIRNCWVSSNDGGKWYSVIVLDGSARASPQGLRMVVIENCELFNAEVASIWANDCVALKVRGVGCFMENCGIYLLGRSTDCSFTDITNNGFLHIDDTTTICSYSGNMDSLNAGKSSYWRISATCTGSSINNLINSDVRLLR